MGEPYFFGLTCGTNGDRSVFLENKMTRANGVFVAVSEIPDMTTPKDADDKFSGKSSMVCRENPDQTRDVLGQCLRRIYRDVTEEPIPDSIADVLKKLE